MQSTKLDVNKQIQIAVKTGQVTLGVKSTIDAARFAKAKLIIVASNCPQNFKSDIVQYAKLSSLPIFNYAGNSLDLGAACQKPFMVAALAVKEPGDSEILKLAEH